MRYGRWRAAGLVALFLLLVAAGAAALWICRDTGQVIPGVTVLERPVGGMDRDQVRRLLTEMQDVWASARVRIKGDDLTRELTLGELGFTLDVSAVTEQALSVGHRGGWLGRQLREQWVARQRGWAVEPRLHFEEQRLQQVLDDLAARVRQDPSDAKLITEGPLVIILPDRPGVALDAGSIRADLRTLLQRARAARPVPEGRALLGDVALAVRRTTAAVTEQQLKALGIRKQVAETSTRFDPSLAGRAENIRLAASRFDGVLLKPGETLSFSQQLGPVTEQAGFKDAIVILDGQFTPGIGGGVCQVSSTLYNAALHTDLQVVERRNHSLPVHYLPPGLDATIADDYIDLKLRNPGPGHMLIKTEVGGGKLTVRLFGDAPANRTVKLESRVLQTYPFERKVVDDPALPEGETRVKMPGDSGKTAVVLRRIFEGQKLVREEVISRDTYDSAPEIVQRGTGPKPR